jgi:hypothetical protein
MLNIPQMPTTQIQGCIIEIGQNYFTLRKNEMDIKILNPHKFNMPWHSWISVIVVEKFKYLEAVDITILA